MTIEDDSSPPASSIAALPAVVDAESDLGRYSPRIYGGLGPRTRSMSRSHSLIAMQGIPPAAEQAFDVDDFHFPYILGEGRAQVCFDDRLGIAVKHVDLWKSPEMLAEMRNELTVYKNLADLQGKCIPKVDRYGTWQGSYCIGLSMHGKNPERLDAYQKQSLMEIMDAIHARGVIHNDIKRENILVDDLGNPFMIDFGFAEMKECEEARELERNQLRKCLSLL